MWRIWWATVLFRQGLRTYETDWFFEVRRLVECPKAFRPMRKHRATCCTSTKKECRIYRMKSNWQNCVLMQDLSKQLVLDNSSWRRILMNSLDLMVMWVVENLHFYETTNHHLQKDGFVETRTLVLCWKLRPNTIKESWGIEVRINFLSRDGSHSWVRISSGLNRFVRDLTEKAQTPGTNDENDSEKNRDTCWARNENCETLSEWGSQTCSKSEA